MVIDIDGLMLDLDRLANDNGAVPDTSGDPGETLENGHYTVVMISNGKPVLAEQADDADALDAKRRGWLSAGTVEAVVLGDYDGKENVIHIDQIEHRSHDTYFPQ